MLHLLIARALPRSANGGIKRLRHPARQFSGEGSQGSLGAATWRGVPRFYQHCGAAPHPSGTGWQVLIEGRPLRSNAAAELTLPSQGLALAIAGEFAAQGAMIVPATTALYNLASTATDTYASEDPTSTADYEAYLRATRLSTFDLLEARQEAQGSDSAAARESVAAIVASARALEGAGVPDHASLESGRSGSGAMTSGAGSGTSRLRDLLLDSLETDSVCYRVDWNTGDPSERLLRKRQDRYYAPLQAWFSTTYASTLGTALGFADLVHPDSAYIATEGEVDEASPWVKAVLQQVVGATKSTVVTLAFVHRHLDCEGALEASRLEEEWQINQHGEVEDGHDTARSYARLQLATAAAFLSLLPAPALPPALPSATAKNYADLMLARAAQRTARVAARRAREAALVAEKRAAMRAHALAEARSVEVTTGKGI